MVQRKFTVFYDDITGEEIPEGGGGPVEFSLEGQAYTIDLTDENAERLRTIMASYIAKASPVTRRSRGRSGGTDSGAASEIRKWARDNGHEVPDRGRIPSEVLAAFESADGPGRG